MTRIYGIDIHRDSRRVEGLLRGYCGECKSEINVLLVALKCHIVTDLLTGSDSILPQVLLKKLCNRLIDEYSKNDNAGMWAIDSWAIAVGNLCFASPGEQQSLATCDQSPGTATSLPIQPDQEVVPDEDEDEEAYEHNFDRSVFEEDSLQVVKELVKIRPSLVNKLRRFDYLEREYGHFQNEVVKELFVSMACDIDDLFKAIDSNDFQAVKFLILSNSYFINTVNFRDSFPLHQACQVRNIDIVNFLITNGAKINARSIAKEIEKGGLTPLHLACSSGCREIVEFLIVQGADRNAVCDPTGNVMSDYTPRDFAEMQNHTEIVRILSD